MTTPRNTNTDTVVALVHYKAAVEKDRTIEALTLATPLVDTLTLVMHAVDALADIANDQFDGSPWDKFTCREAEAVAEVLRTAGYHSAAEKVIEAHATSDDDPHDDHHDEYLVFMDGFNRQP